MTGVHECEPPEDVAADLTWRCSVCGAEWASYPIDETPTFRILSAARGIAYDPTGFAWHAA